MRAFTIWLGALAALFTLSAPAAVPRAAESGSEQKAESYCARLQDLYAGAIDAAYRLSDAKFVVDEYVFGTLDAETAQAEVAATVAQAERQIAVLEAETPSLMPPDLAGSDPATDQFLQDFTATLRKFPRVLRKQISTLEGIGAAAFSGDYVVYDRLSAEGFGDDVFLLSVQNAMLSSFRVASDPEMPETMLLGAMFESNNAQIVLGRALDSFEASRSLEAFSGELQKARGALDRSETALDNTLTANRSARRDDEASAVGTEADGGYADLAARMSENYREAVEVERQLNHGLRVLFALIEQGAYLPSYFENPGIWQRFEIMEAEIATIERRRGELYDRRVELSQEMQRLESGG